jgi:hypothetical protein
MGSMAIGASVPRLHPYGDHYRDEASSGHGLSLRVPVHSMNNPSAEGACLLT